MKKYINRIFGGVLLFALVACSEELIVDQVIDGVESGAILRNLGETNNLDIEDGSSTYSIILEAQDAANGGLLSEVRVSVGFNDIDDAGLDTVALVPNFATIQASAFSPSTNSINGLIETTFTTTLNELLNHVSSTSTLADISATDDFVIDFEMELTDGRVFNEGNATNDVTRTGFFSFFNSQFRYAATVGDPQRLVLKELATTFDMDSKLNRLASTDVDTIFLEFDVETLADFVTQPTVTALSEIGNADDVLGPLVEGTNDDGDEIFYVLYTAGADPGDTISFTVTGGEKTTGFPMANDTLENAYIVDNVPPTGTLGSRTVSTDASGRILNVSLELLYEPLGKDTVEFEIVATGATTFDTQTITKIISKGDELVNIDFVPQVGGVAINEGALTFDINTDPTATTGDGAVDLVGNEAGETISIQLGN